ncbi:MAG: hypothetical protein HC849_29850 [Oscillatoriales cyanobacterium RU_3_3]|nr:hypothetical protein [Oscillatoriales cyanobacterium RU_3_3]
MGKLRAKYFARSYLSIGMYRLRYNGLIWKPQRLERFSRSPHPSTSNAGWDGKLLPFKTSSLFVLSRTKSIAKPAKSGCEPKFSG